MRALARAVSVVQRRLAAIYCLELELRAERYLMNPAVARSLVAGDVARTPRSGLLAVEEDGVLSLGLYVAPEDRLDRGTLIEETSHLLCVAWHAAQDRPVSLLTLEIQAEVDRYAIARLARVGPGALDHFRDFTFDTWLDDRTRHRYETAHRVGRRYCTALSRRFPGRADTPALLGELRRFYRAPAEEKLRAA